MTPPKSPKPAASGSDTPERFEDAVTELERIVASMESGSLSLEESLARFERGIALLHHCRGALESAEQKIRVLQDGVLTSLPSDSTAE